MTHKIIETIAIKLSGMADELSELADELEDIALSEAIQSIDPDQLRESTRAFLEMPLSDNAKKRIESSYSVSLSDGLTRLQGLQAAVASAEEAKEEPGGKHV